MSFRYTHNLVALLKYRLEIEAAHRALARRVFTGVCDGVEVSCSGFGTILSIRLAETEQGREFENTNEKEGPAGVEKDARRVEGQRSSTQTAFRNGDGSLQWERLARSIRAAAWEAQRRLAAAKTAAHAQALRQNPRLLARGRLRDWAEGDAATLPPSFWTGLRQELATPWMQAVRFGKPDAARFLGCVEETIPPKDGTERDAKAASSGLNTPTDASTPPQDPNEDINTTTNNNNNDRSKNGANWGPRVSVLTEADCSPQAIPVASVHPFYTAALIHLELSGEARKAEAARQKDPNDNNNNNRIKHSESSGIAWQAVLQEQRREMCRDEQLFWERVEFIRSGQLATIPGGVKRGYADQSATVQDAVEDKIELRFTQ